MPPDDSRTQSRRPTNDPSRPTSYLPDIQRIEPPIVPNLATTLTLNDDVDDEIDDANVSFLRTPIDPQDEWRAQNAVLDASRHRSSPLPIPYPSDPPSPRPADLRSSHDDRQRRERLQRILSRLNNVYYTPTSAERTTQRTESRNEWGNTASWDPLDEQDPTYREIFDNARRQLPDFPAHSLRVIARDHYLQDRDPQLRPSLRGQPNGMASSHLPSDSLRASAILQSVRRHPRFSARSRDHMSRYIMERERANSTVEDRDRMTRDNAMSPADRYEATRLAWQVEQGDTSEIRAHLSRHQPNFRCSIHTSGSSPLYHAAISYLANIRDSKSEVDSWGIASDRLVRSKQFAPSVDDFVLNVHDLPPPPETSWLATGAVFSGSQHATATSASCPDHLPPPGPVSQHARIRNANSLHRTQSGVDAAWSPESTSSGSASAPSQFDHWPVRVTIHSMDYGTMTLTATMEAYNVPAAPLPSDAGRDPNTSSARVQSITTFLEGEILDFAKHTFLTESFQSNLDHDALYWSKLEPMKSVASSTTNSTDPNNHRPDGDDSVNPRSLPHAITSRAWLEQLQRTHVLMRWKERCFVKATSRPAHSVSGDSDSGFAPFRSLSADDEDVVHEDGCGLTINGFYYISLRRSDGAIEGLYCDPASSPYQHLKLKAVGRGVAPAWEFR